MKKWLSLLVLPLLLCACGNNTPSGDNTNACSVLNVYNAGEYIDENVNEIFAKEHGVKVNYSLFASNEEMYTKLMSGTKYDVIIPSDYMIQKMISENLLQKIDRNKITNFDNLYEGTLNKAFDPLNEYSIPYFWGNVGIVYYTTKIDPKDVESEGWNVFQNTKYKGMIYMYDSERDAFMMALKALGYSMNTTSLDELNEAYEWLAQVQTTMDPLTATDEAIDGLIYGQKAMGMMYSGDAAYILSENEDMAYFVPEEGTNLWVDAMVIPANASCPELAHEYINYMLDYDTALANSSFVGYSSSNKEVFEELAGEGGDYEGINAYTPRVNYAKDEVFVNNEEVRKVISELWIKVKALNKQ